jgi:hypothetical protein
MNTQQFDPTTISDLRATLSGRVITPTDPEYDQARRLFYGGMGRHPALIIRVAKDTDVARVIALARDTGLDLGVRSGGHSIPGHSVPEGGIVLDLADMRALDIDAEARTAWAEAGLTAAEYTNATATHGLATGFGDTGSVGIGGITLGGGVGYLSRKHGLTIDSLLAADIVTADGRLLRVDANTNPDLFWAIRGGGGNFGVVTRFQYRLHEVGTVVGGMLILPATPDTVAAFITLADGAPDELSTIANVLPSPPMPFVPAEHHGKLVIMGMLVYAGDIESGQREVAPFREIATPIVDMVRPMPYPQIYPPDDENYRPTAVARTMFVNTIDSSVAALILERLRSSTAQMAAAQLRVLGGAVSRVPVDATAYAHRHSKIMVNVAALYSRPDEKPLHEAFVTGFAAALNQGDTAAYVNFLDDEGQARIRAAYPGPTWDRLASIKARFDPDNLFRLNQNIPPTPQNAESK